MDMTVLSKIFGFSPASHLFDLFLGLDRSFRWKYNKGHALKGARGNSHLETNKAFRWLHIERDSIVCLYWSLDPQKLPIVICVENQANETVFLGWDPHFRDSWLKVAAMCEGLVSVLGRYIAVRHREAYRVNIASDTVIQPHDIVVLQWWFLLALHKVWMRPLLDRVVEATAVERRVSNDNLIYFWIRFVHFEVHLSDGLDVCDLTLTQAGKRTDHESLWADD